MFYSEEGKLHHKLQWSVELRIFFSHSLEYEAELPPFPEGCKVKPEGMITVSITQAPTQIKGSYVRTVPMTGECQCHELGRWEREGTGVKTRNGGQY